MYYFVRSVPVLVGVEADNESEGWKLSGDRVDDFMSDAVQDVELVSHVDGTPYHLEYHGDAIYASQIPAAPSDGSDAILPQH